MIAMPEELQPAWVAVDGLFPISAVFSRLSGITYRQIDYWQRTGAINIAYPARRSGSRRRYSQRDIERLMVIDRVNASGVFPNGIPHQIVAEIWTRLAYGDWPTMLHVFWHDGTWRATPYPPPPSLGLGSWLTIDARIPE